MTKEVEIRNSIWEMLKEIAEQEDETIAGIVNRILEEYIEANYETENGESDDEEDDDLDIEDLEEE